MCQKPNNLICTFARVLVIIASLSSLALGLGGSSLIWGPVATAIVSGLTFSSVLTLFAIPLLYRLFVKAPDIS